MKKTYDAYYPGAAWVKGILELDSHATGPRFVFKADVVTDLPVGGTVREVGRDSGTVHKARLTERAGLYSKPPPGYGLVSVCPTPPAPPRAEGDNTYEQREGEIPIWLVFAVQDPTGLVAAVKELR